MFQHPTSSTVSNAGKLQTQTGWVHLPEQQQTSTVFNIQSIPICCGSRSIHLRHFCHASRLSVVPDEWSSLKLKAIECHLDKNVHDVFVMFEEEKAFYPERI